MQHDVVWVTHPRHLPKAPRGRAVVVDVAFAAGGQWRQKTLPFVNALGDRLMRYVDHHVHPEAWQHFAGDPRFVLVPNKVAHACPELVTPELVASTGPIETVVAHCDFDGAVAAMKWWRAGVEPWPGADEDARAIDSPGRGHVLTPLGARIAGAMDEASARYPREQQLQFMSAVVAAGIAGQAASSSIALDEEIDLLARGAHEAELADRELAARCGEQLDAGVFLVRVPDKLDNRSRKNLLVFAEERARIGALLEPDPAGGHWLYAATFDESLDLERVDGFAGGRSDFRFARASQGGVALIAALRDYAETAPR